MLVVVVIVHAHVSSHLIIVLASRSIWEHLWREALTDDVEGLLFILQYNFTVLFEACDLNFDYISDAFPIVFDVPDAIIILYHTWYSEVETAENDFLLDVFDERLDISIDADGCHIFNISIDEWVTNTFAGIT